MALTFEGLFTSGGHDFFLECTTGLIDYNVDM